jgi:hypothetical protein
LLNHPKLRNADLYAALAAMLRIDDMMARAEHRRAQYRRAAELVDKVILQRRASLIAGGE